MRDQRDLTFTIRAQALRTKGSAGVWDEQGGTEKVVKVVVDEQTEEKNGAAEPARTESSVVENATKEAVADKDEL